MRGCIARTALERQPRTGEVLWSASIRQNFRKESTVMTTTLGAAFIANANTKDVLFCTSTDGTNWSNNLPVHQFSKTTPSVAFFDFKFWVAFVDNTTNNNLLICSSPDGVTWTPLTAVGQLSKSPPSLVVFKNGLWLAFLAANTSNEILICSSPDGTNWAGSTSVGDRTKTAPALTVFNNRLWMAFVETIRTFDLPCPHRSLILLR